MKAKKSFGQNWLRDEYVLDEIVNSAKIDSQDLLLEVGPGLGTLTRKLVETKADVIAVEADSDLLPRLNNMFQGKTNFELTQGDILKFDLDVLRPQYKVVANIPYYLTSALIRMLLESNNPPKLMVLLVQKEVAQRILSRPGQMSILSFSVQYYAIPEFIIRISMLKKPCFEANTKKLFRLVRAGFGEKRKMLRNSLAGGLDSSPEVIQELLGSAKISPTARAQELTMEDWKSLYDNALSMRLV